jgi:hypothetical protein
MQSALLETNFPCLLSGELFHSIFSSTNEDCQWQEFRHVDRKVVGKEPDRCRDAWGAQCDVSCATRSLSSCESSRDRDREGQPAACCVVAEGADLVEEEVSFTYHKAWRRHRINSLLFDNAIAYHNPQRDPAPPLHVVSTVDVALAAPPSSGASSDASSSSSYAPLVVEASHLGPALSSWEPVLLDGAAAAKVSSAAIRDGFRELGKRLGR